MTAVSCAWPRCSSCWSTRPTSKSMNDIAPAQRDLQILWQWQLRPLCVVVSVSVSEDRMQPTISLEREYAGVTAEGLVLGDVDRGVLIQLVKPARHAPGQVLGAGTRQQSAAQCPHRGRISQHGRE
jgi:hypothetical protein